MKNQEVYKSITNREKLFERSEHWKSDSKDQYQINFF